MSLGFSVYVGRFGNYDRTYGSLGAIVGFMTWIWLSLTIVLMGAEFNSEMEDQAARSRQTLAWAVTGLRTLSRCNPRRGRRALRWAWPGSYMQGRWRRTTTRPRLPPTGGAEAPDKWAKRLAIPALGRDQAADYERLKQTAEARAAGARRRRARPAAQGRPRPQRHAAPDLRGDLPWHRRLAPVPGRAAGARRPAPGRPQARAAGRGRWRRPGSTRWSAGR